MRRVLIDGEFSGPGKKNDCIIEWAMIETVDHVPTGRIYHQYFKPTTEIQPFTSRIHGLTDEMLSKSPRFTAEAQNIRSFIGGSEVVALGAGAERKMLRREMERAHMRSLPESQIKCATHDIRSFTGGGMSAPCGIDACIDLFNLNVSKREFHSALTDTAILAAILAHINGKPSVDISSLCARATQLEMSTPAHIIPYTRKKKVKAILSQEIMDDYGNLLNLVHAAYESAVDFEDFIDTLNEKDVFLTFRMQQDPSDPMDETVKAIRFYTKTVTATHKNLGLPIEGFHQGDLAFLSDQHSHLITAATMRLQQLIVNKRMPEIKNLEEMTPEKIEGVLRTAPERQTVHPSFRC